ncbi:hypothetical protein G7072_18170 [Nocardioides sp. HDW12B]|uniref:hypothetical protein n=1 Tax=Nocardioides sp. HDW12B TaxID=2714939 RepID=UPI001409B6B8|nr:hypothetical protein [Nocardioides sp. HDW12B]QIK68013.1 hypothetical protein G7072_18170 [Nocardioides sp. HDW12B]
MRSVDLVENKLREADYFLGRMGEAGFNVWAFQCDFTAFLASARSVTFTMQAVMSGHGEWDDWYEERRNRLLAGPRGRFMVNMRNITQKVGDVGLNSGVGGPGQRAQQFFPKSLTAKLSSREQDLDAFALSERHMGVLVRLVQEWLYDFRAMWGVEVPVVWSGSIDELEAGLGFPAGWTTDIVDDASGEEVLLLSSPGEFFPNIDDLAARYPLIPDA